MSGIALTQNLVSATGTLPILSNLLIEADSKDVNLVTTDLEAFAKVSLQAKIEESGRITAPAKTLGDIVRRLPDDDISITTSGTRLTLTCNRNVYHLATMSADDYPEWPKSESVTRITLRQADLKRLLRSTTFAIPLRDPRKVLMGALFVLNAEGLICVATDGRKLGKSMAEPVEIRGKAECSAIIPGRILTELDKALGEEGEIELALTERQALFSLPNLTYLTSLIEGSFPKYDSVIPESFKKIIELPKATLDETIGRASILAERKFNSIVLGFSQNNLDIHAQSFEDGSYDGQVQVNYEGEPFKIAFSHQYLHEVFKVMPDAVVRMKVKDNTAPVVFEADSDPTSLFLVMPVRMHDLDGPGEEESPEQAEDEE